MQWFEAGHEFLSDPIRVGGDSYSGIVAPLVTQEIANGIAPLTQFLLFN